MEPITSTQLQPTTPLNLPPTTQPDFSSYLTISPIQQQELDTTKKAKKTSYDQLVNEQLGLTTQGKRTLQYENDAGIPGLTNQLTEVENQITATDLNFRRERDRITNEAGMTVGQRNARLADVSRKQGSQLADLEVIRAARSNVLSNAQSFVQKKTALEFADEQARVDRLKYIYENNDGEYKDQLAQVYKREERAFQVKKQEYETMESEKINLVKNAQANGAGNQTLSAILQSKTLEEAYKNAGSYGVSIDDKIKKLKYSELVNASSGGTKSLTDKQKQDLIKNPTAQKAVARIGVINAVNEFNKKMLKYKGAGGIFDFNRLTKAEKVELQTALNTTVGSAINVAQGQGAMGDQEAQRILGDLNPTRWKRTSTIDAAAKGVIGAQNSLLSTDLEYLESAIPGVTDNFDVFKKYKTDNLPPEEKKKVQLQSSLQTFRDNGISDEQSIEYFIENDPENADIIRQLSEEGYTLEDIINSL